MGSPSVTVNKKLIGGGTTQMRSLETTHMTARLTSGQVLDIRYDPLTNAITFREDDWTANVRGPATPRCVFREQLDTGKIRRLPRRRAA
jgi:hypothetical protein